MVRKVAIYNATTELFVPNLASSVEQSLVQATTKFKGDLNEDISMGIILLHLLTSPECPSVKRALTSLDIQRNILNILPRDKFVIPACSSNLDSVEVLVRKNDVLRRQVAYYQKKLQNLDIPDELSSQKGKQMLDTLLDKELEIFQEESGNAEAEENLPRFADQITKMQLLQQTLNETIDQYTFAEKRRKERQDCLQSLMESFFKTIGDKSDAIEVLKGNLDRLYMFQNINPSEDDPARVKRCKAKIRNKKLDLRRAITDFTMILFNSIVSEDDEFALELKLPIIKEFIDCVRDKHFSPIACCRRIDMSMKQNVSALLENIGLTSFYHKKEDKSVKDLVNNVHIRGGDKARRYSLMTSVPRFFQMRRRTEALMVELVGATRTKDNVAAQIDVVKFVDLYFQRLFRSLDATHFDEHGVCKFEVFLDLTNDGTVYSNMSLNIAGLKIFPIPLKVNGNEIDANVKKAMLHDRTVCLPLSVFIDKDNKDNLMQYHSQMYTLLKQHFGTDGTHKVKVGDKSYTFVVKYAFSGDLKSHALAAGLETLCGVNVANFMFCCVDKQKHSLLLPNSKRCHWCVDCPAQKKCRHIPYTRKLWTMPKRYSKLQPIMDAVRSSDFVVNTLRDNFTNGRKKRTLDEMQNYESDKPCFHFIDWNLSREDHNYRYAKQCARLSEFESVKTGKALEKFIKDEYLPKTPRIVLETCQSNSSFGDNTTYVCIDNANIFQLQHHLRIRACQNREDMMRYQHDYAGMNKRIIELLEKEYNFIVDPDIVNGIDVLKQSKELLYILMIVESYALYFLEENNHAASAIVDDKMKLVICDLHMEMRIGLKLLENLINNCILYRFSTNFAKELIEFIQTWINTEVFRNKGTGKGTYKFPIKDGKCEAITLTNVSLMKILLNINTLVDIIQTFKVNEQQQHLNPSSNNANSSNVHDPERYRNVISGFTNLMKTLRQFGDNNTDEEFIDWQLQVVDPWIDDYINLFGKVDAGYYVHYLARGHICEQLMYFKNLHRHSQQNWEGLVGRIKKYIASHTQHGGNSSGGKGSKRQESLNVAILRYMLRLSLFTLFPDDDDILDLLEEYKDKIDEKMSLQAVKVTGEDVEQEDDIVVDEEGNIQPKENAVGSSSTDADVLLGDFSAVPDAQQMHFTTFPQNGAI